jgi:hypothetical protein
MARGVFDVEFSTAVEDYVLVERDRPANQRKVFASRRGERGQLIEAYGLLTILPSEGSDGNERVVVVSGTYSAGMAAAMEFFASGPRMRELRDRLQREGQKGFPPAYQVVVKATTDSTLPLGASYAAHRVMK